MRHDSAGKKQGN